MKPEVETYYGNVEVFVRVLAPGLGTADEPAVVVTTFLHGRFYDREHYNLLGQEIVL